MDAHLTMADLRAQRSAGTLNDFVNRINYVAANIRGTSGYWFRRRQELLSLFEQEGLPTVFFTLSCADFHWRDMHKHMPDQPDSPTDRRNAALQNPHIVDRYFHDRVQAFLRSFFVDGLGAQWYWTRYEYQARGTVHLHGCGQVGE